MILVIGEILYDELPTGCRPGGAPFNVARHLARLGAEVLFVSRVGCDEAGEALLAEVAKGGLDASHIQRDPGHATGRVSVSLDDRGVPSYGIVEDVAYDHIDFDGLEKACKGADLLYFGSLVQRTDVGRTRLQDFLESMPYGIIQFYDMNLRAGCDRREIVLPSLERTDILKLNEEELAAAGRLAGLEQEGEELAAKLMDSFGIRQLALTRGPRGSVLLGNGMRHEQEATPLGEGQIVDTVGAGDAFAAVLAWGFQRGMLPGKVLHHAGGLAEKVCTIPGAVPADDAFYRPITETLERGSA